MIRPDTGNDYIGLCIICRWHSESYPFEDIAQWRITWHVYEDHRDVWDVLVGNREPQDPDPRKLEDYTPWIERMLHI